MKNLKIFILKLVFFTINIFLGQNLKSNINDIDVTFVGYIKQADGLGRLTIELIDILKDCLNINFLNSHPNSSWHLNDRDISTELKKIIDKKYQKAGKIALFTDLLWYQGVDWTQAIPNSKIKIAFSMFETSKIPNIWVNILNKKFDAVIVPDEFVKSTYLNSKVTIPIFVIPIPLNLKNLLSKPLKKDRQNVFVFGSSALFDQRKNQIMMIESFSKAFSNLENVELIIHGRGGIGDILDSLYQKLNSLGNPKNIKIISTDFSKTDYENFLTTLDCYLFLTKGEGFSITPREALALGIPCILTNNSANKTICDTNYVYSIAAKIAEVPNYKVLFGNQAVDIGYLFNCDVNDVAKALKGVYHNYYEWLRRAEQGREWTKRYLPENVKPLLLSLLKPKYIKIGNEDRIKDNGIMTTSRKLYLKFKNYFKI